MDQLGKARTMKPNIGIPLPTSSDFEYNNRYWSDYAAAVNRAGGFAVQIPLADANKRERLIRDCSGFVLPGSPADVDPEHYGHTRETASAPADPGRETCDAAIAEYAERTGSPLLAICFGLQSLNVVRGGTLVQDLRPVPVNHSAGAQVGVAHGVLVSGMSLLGGLLGASEGQQAGQFRHLTVNSSHHQAVAIPGEGFTVVARSVEDGVVEAMEARFREAPVLAVQWHPERSCDMSALSRSIFLWLVTAAMDADDTQTFRGGAGLG